MIRLTAKQAKKLTGKAAQMVATHDPFVQLCLAHGLPAPVKEFRFHPTRKWRFDYAWEGCWEYFIAMEVEGGVWTGGRHTRGKGFLGDMEKYNEAAIMGWCVLRCTPKDIKSGKAVELVKRAMECGR